MEVWKVCTPRRERAKSGALEIGHWCYAAMGSIEDNGLFERVFERLSARVFKRGSVLLRTINCR